MRVLGLRLSSSRRHGEFLRLLFLQAHRETAAHFTAIAMPQPNGPRPGYPRYGHCFLIQSLTLARAFARSHSLSLPLTALSLSLSLSLSFSLPPSLSHAHAHTACSRSGPRGGKTVLGQSRRDCWECVSMSPKGTNDLQGNFFVCFLGPVSSAMPQSRRGCLGCGDITYVVLFVTCEKTKRFANGLYVITQHQ